MTFPIPPVMCADCGTLVDVLPCPNEWRHELGHLAELLREGEVFTTAVERAYGSAANAPTEVLDLVMAVAARASERALIPTRLAR